MNRPYRGNGLWRKGGPDKFRNGKRGVASAWQHDKYDQFEKGFQEDTPNKIHKPKRRWNSNSFGEQRDPSCSVRIEMVIDGNRYHLFVNLNQPESVILGELSNFTNQMLDNRPSHSPLELQIAIISEIIRVLDDGTLRFGALLEERIKLLLSST